MVANIFLKFSGKIARNYLKIATKPKYTKEMADAIRSYTESTGFSRSTLKKMARERISLQSYSDKIKIDPVYRDTWESSIEKIVNKDWSAWRPSSKVLPKVFKEELR